MDDGVILPVGLGVGVRVRVCVKVTVGDRVTEVADGVMLEVTDGVTLEVTESVNEAVLVRVGTSAPLPPLSGLISL